MLVGRQKKIAENEPWDYWTSRDDRAWLKRLSSHKWATPYTKTSLQEVLDTIVTSLSASHHSRWSSSLSKSELSALEVPFLGWLRESGSWDEVKKAWDTNADGPWSLPFFLSRAYFRFVEKTNKQKSTEQSLSGQRHLLELPTPSNFEGISGQITPHLLTAFAAMTHELPAEIRLSYQLHLEGLLNNEIAGLLHLELAQVQNHIDAAKETLGGTRKYGT